jgi:hypothetical protein
MKLKFQILIMLCLLFGAFGVLAQDATEIVDIVPMQEVVEAPSLPDNVGEVSPDVLRVNTIQNLFEN